MLNFHRPIQREEQIIQSSDVKIAGLPISFIPLRTNQICFNRLDLPLRNYANIPKYSVSCSPVSPYVRNEIVIVRHLFLYIKI